MKRIIKLTETDLTRIVKRVISEGGYEGIKRDLEHVGGIYDIGQQIGDGIDNFRQTKKQLKAILMGDGYEFHKSGILKVILREISVLYTKLVKLRKLVSLFEERDMKLTKSDLGDYGFEIYDLLDMLNSHYDKVNELKDSASDDEIMRYLNSYERTLDKTVELLDSIPD